MRSDHRMFKCSHIANFKGKEKTRYTKYKYIQKLLSITIASVLVKKATAKYKTIYKTKTFL